MRSLAYFLLIFLPLALLLWLAQSNARAASSLPDTVDVSDASLIDARELGAGDLAARIIELKGVQLRLLHEEEVRCYVKLGELVRHEGRPRVLDILIAIFEDKRLKLTIESPFAEGDIGGLLAREDGARVVAFGGGVVVRDAQAREVARVARAELDIETLTLRSIDRVTMRLAERDIEISGNGFLAHLKKGARDARIERDIVLTVPTGEGTARLRCRGPAMLEELASGDLMATLANEVVVEHPLAHATCDIIVAIVGSGNRRALRRATMSGSVVIDVGADKASGLESIRAPHVVLDGEEQILLRDFTATRKGSFPGLGPDERTLDISAGSAALTLVRESEKKVGIWEMSLKGGVIARDRHGPATFAARSLLINEATGTFDAWGGVMAKTPDGLLAAQSVHAKRVGANGYDLRVEGPDKRIEYVVDGKLGPLGEGRRGRLIIRARGALKATLRESTALLRADGGVSVSLEPGSRLTCRRLALLVRDKKPDWLEARGSVHLVDREQGAELSGDSLVYREKSALLRGSPARVRAAGRGSVRAGVIAYRDAGDFAARDDVTVTARLDRSGEPQSWTIRCGQASGRLRKGAVPEFVEARGDVLAKGPQGQHFAGNTLRFDAGTGDGDGKATLRGDPAVVQRGKGLRLRSLQIDLQFKGKALVALSTPWPAEVEIQPAKATEGGGKSIARWHFKLPSAVFAGDRLTSPRGASFDAFDAKGVRQVSGRASRVVVFLRRVGKGWEPVRLLCSKGVSARAHGKRPARVTADRLEFLVGSRQIDLSGHARVKAKGWSPEATFDRLIFVLTRDGVDLKRASGITVRDARR